MTKFDDSNRSDVKLKKDRKETSITIPLIKDSTKYINDVIQVDLNIVLSKLSPTDLKTYCESLKHACK